MSLATAQEGTIVYILPGSAPSMESFAGCLQHMDEVIAKYDSMFKGPLDHHLH